MFPQAVPGFLASPSLLTASVSSLTPWVVNLGCGVLWRTVTVLKVAGTLISEDQEPKVMHPVYANMLVSSEILLLGKCLSSNFVSTNEQSSDSESHSPESLQQLFLFQLYKYKIYLFGPVLVHNGIRNHAKISNQQSLLKMSLV